MAAINEKRVKWRKVAEERGEETNALRTRILKAQATLELNRNAMALTAFQAISKALKG